MEAIKNVSEEFTAALAKWLETADSRIAAHYAKHYPRLSPGFFEVEDAPKFIRIVRCNPQRCVFAFIAKRNGETKTLGRFQVGDLLKASSWKAPARSARGSIFDAAGGMERTTIYGVK